MSRVGLVAHQSIGLGCTGTRISSAARTATRASVSAWGGVSTMIRSFSRFRRSISPDSFQPATSEAKGEPPMPASERKPCQAFIEPCGSTSSKVTVLPLARPPHAKLHGDRGLAGSAFLLRHRQDFRRHIDLAILRCTMEPERNGWLFQATFRLSQSKLNSDPNRSIPSPLISISVGLPHTRSETALPAPQAMVQPKVP